MIFRSNFSGIFCSRCHRGCHAHAFRVLLVVFQAIRTHAVPLLKIVIISSKVCNVLLISDTLAMSHFRVQGASTVQHSGTW